MTKDNKRLQVRVGSSLDTLAVANPNDEASPVLVHSPFFTGQILVRMRDFEGHVPEGKTLIPDLPLYFDNLQRISSFQISGIFHKVRLPYLFAEL
jgi:hypothetical protein